MNRKKDYPLGRNILLFYLVMLFQFPGYAQENTEKSPANKKDSSVYDIVYRYDGSFRKTDLALMSVASGMLITAHYSNPSPLTESEVVALDPMDINKFDRPAIHNNNEAAGHLSDYFLIGSFALPAAVSVFAPDNSKERYNALFMSLETILIANSLNVFTKVVAERRRPYVYNPDVPMHRKTSTGALASFYSGHTANVAAMTFLAAKLLNDYNPQSVFVDVVVWPVAALVPAVQGYLRVEAGQHFPSDVLLGYGIGALTGFAIPWLHHHERYKKNKGQASINIYPSFYSGGTGISMSFIF